MRVMSILLLSMIAVGSFAETDKANNSVTEVSTEAMNIKQSVLELNRDLYQLEQDLLSPATTRAAVYFSLDKGKLFQPHSISISVDDKAPIQYLYTDKEVDVLRQGAIQPLKDLNLGPGKHTLKAVVKGVDENGNASELTLARFIEKRGEPLYLEIKIKDNNKLGKAELKISQW